MVVLLALLGLVTGSAINWLADRAPEWARDRERARLVHDRRLCGYCGEPTRAGPESALARFVLRRGRCTHCSAPLPLRPLVVEIVAAAAFALLWAHDMDPAAPYGGEASGTRLLLHALFLAVFLLVTVTDLEHHLIVDAHMLPAIALAAAAAVITGAWRDALIGGAIGFAFFYVAALIGQAVFGSGALGFGDVTLAAFIGLVTGFPLVIVALVLGIFTGGAVIALLLITRVRGLHSAVPYGPFLVAGGVATMLWGPQIVYWYFHR